MSVTTTTTESELQPTPETSTQYQHAVAQLDQVCEDSLVRATTDFQDAVSPEVSLTQKRSAEIALISSITSAQATLEDASTPSSATTIEHDVHEYQQSRDVALTEYHDAVALGDTSLATEMSLGTALSDARHTFVLAVGTPPTPQEVAAAADTFEKTREEALATYLAATPAFVPAASRDSAKEVLYAQRTRAFAARKDGVAALGAAPAPSCQLSLALTPTANVTPLANIFSKKAFRRSRGPGRLAIFLGL